MLNFAKKLGYVYYFPRADNLFPSGVRRVFHDYASMHRGSLSAILQSKNKALLLVRGWCNWAQRTKTGKIDLCIMYGAIMVLCTLYNVCILHNVTIEKY